MQRPSAKSDLLNLCGAIIAYCTNEYSINNQFLSLQNRIEAAIGFLTQQEKQSQLQKEKENLQQEKDKLDLLVKNANHILSNMKHIADGGKNKIALNAAITYYADTWIPLQQKLDNKQSIKSQLTFSAARLASTVILLEFLQKIQTSLGIPTIATELPSTTTGNNKRKREDDNDSDDATPKNKANTSRTLPPPKKKGQNGRKSKDDGDDSGSYHP